MYLLTASIETFLPFQNSDFFDGRILRLPRLPVEVDALPEPEIVIDDRLIAKFFGLPKAFAGLRHDAQCMWIDSGLSYEVPFGQYLTV